LEGVAIGGAILRPGHYNPTPVTRPLLALLLLAAAPKACVVYEYEHEFWLRVDGSGSVNVSGRPELWRAFKGLPVSADADAESLRGAARQLFEGAGLRVRRVTVTRRAGRPQLFVAADFADLNRLGGSAAFRDLVLSLRRAEGRLELEGAWQRPEGFPDPDADSLAGLMAVRFHLPSKVYAHKNAFEGVERGNIVSWRQGLELAVRGERLELGATLDARSILGSTLTLFAAAIVVALALLGLALWLTARRGRRARAP
jgi:hypothetical protein